MTTLTDTDPDTALGPLQAAACTYRIALGPRAGQRARPLTSPADGIDDLLIGASLADPNGDGSGASYVVFGQATPPVTCNGLPATILGTFGQDTLVGTPGNDVIHGRGGNDTIRGLGGRHHLWRRG
ncbi:MAG: hypothetical protein ACHBMF_04515 [Chromatiales bacterium]